MDQRDLLDLARTINGLATVADRLQAVSDFCNRNPCYKRKDVDKRVKEMSAFVYVVSVDLFRKLVLCAYKENLEDEFSDLVRTYFKDKRPATYLADKPLQVIWPIPEKPGLMDAEVPEKPLAREDYSSSIRDVSDRGESIMKYFRQKHPASDSLGSLQVVSCASSTHPPTRTFMSLVAEEYELKEEEQGADELEERITRIDVEKINVGQYVKEKMQATRAFAVERSVVKAVRMHKSEKENSQKKPDSLTRPKAAAKQADIAALIKTKVASKTVAPTTRLREVRETALPMEPTPSASEQPLKKRIATKSQGNQPASQPSSTGILKNMLHTATGKKSDARSRVFGGVEQPSAASNPKPQGPRASSSQQQTTVTVDSILGRGNRQPDPQPAASLKPVRNSGAQKKVSQTEISNYMKKSD